MTQKSIKYQSIAKVLIFIGIIFMLNIIGNFVFGTIDLTEEKRFTLTDPTKKVLKELDNVVYVKVLLDGELPAGIKRLQKATQEMLDDFRTHSGYVEYTFENPLEGTVEKVNENKEFLAKQFILPNNLIVKGKEDKREMLFYTYAIISYKGQSLPLNLVDQKGGNLSEFVINNSISLLEYKLADAIVKIQKTLKPTVAFTTGHGELKEIQTKDIRQTLLPYYKVGTFNLDSATYISQNVEVLIVAKPRTTFPIKHKFMIDQYIMNGGNVIWLLDKLAINMDSLRNPQFVPNEYSLDLDDLLYNYGARIQPNLIMDQQCAKIQLQVDENGTKDYFDWYFHPIVSPDTEHPMAKNLDGINFFFPSSIDTIRTKTPVKKTPILVSTDRTLIKRTPLVLNFSDILRNPLPADKWKKGRHTFALLLEGDFPSEYEGRLTTQMRESLELIDQPFKAISSDTKQLVISDGDLIKNLIYPNNKEAVPLGYNQDMRYTFANKPFIINAIEYMMDGSGVMEARSKDVKLRLLDNGKAQQERRYWQLLNILLPLILLILFGILFNFIRKRKYA